MKQLDIFNDQPKNKSSESNPEILKLEKTLSMIETVYGEIINSFNPIVYSEASAIAETAEINRLYGEGFAKYNKVDRQDARGGYRYVLVTLNENELRKHIAEKKLGKSVAA